MTPRFIPYDDLKAKGIPLSKVQLGRLEKAGKFPRRVRISGARVAWVEQEIDAHVAGLAQNRETIAATFPKTPTWPKGKPRPRKKPAKAAGRSASIGAA